VTPPVPTALGVKALLFYGSLVGAFLAAPYLNLFFLLLAFLTVLGITGLFATASGLRGVGGEVLTIAPVPAGVGAEVVASVAARGRRPSVGLRLDLEGLGKVTLGSGLVRESGRLAGRLPALPRGIYEVRSAALVSTWPYGLFRVAKPVPAPSEIVVYPEPAELGDAPDSEGVSSLLGALSGESGGLQPSHLREYVPGDELRKVHWKATARRDALVITEWEGGMGEGAEVVLDRRAEPAVLEEALSFLAAVALAARDAKEVLTIHSQGHRATYGTGHEAFPKALRFLAAADALPPSGPPPPVVSPEILRLPVAGGGA
jgi:uncharacterized protein (DUF58 family)